MRNDEELGMYFDKETIEEVENNTIPTFMEPKDKAKEFIEKFYLIKDERGLCRLNEYIAIHCAIIAVDEIIKTLKEIESYKDVNPNMPIDYWQEVKTEIQNYDNSI